MNLDKLLSRLLLFCIPLYFTQGWLFESGAIVSQSLIGIWLVIDCYYLVIYFQKGSKSSIGNSIIAFWLIGTIYWILSPKVVSMPGQTFATYGDYKNLSLVVLSYFPFLVLSRTGIISERWVRWFVLLMTLSAIIAYRLKATEILDIYGRDVTNNTAYYFAVLLPFLGVFWGEKKLYLIFGILLYFMLMCVKRGAFVCAIISLLLFLIIRFNNVRLKNFIPRVIGSIVVIGVVWYVVDYFIGTNELLQQRLLETEEGDTSHRDILYGSLWDLFIEGGVVHKLFGHGMSQSVTLVRSYAHSDWLELLIDEGLLGVTLYATIFISAIRYYFSNRKNMYNRYKYIFITALLCFLARSIFSMGYMAPESALFTIALGVTQGFNNKYKIVNEYKE